MTASTPQPEPCPYGLHAPGWCGPGPCATPICGARPPAPSEPPTAAQEGSVRASLRAAHERAEALPPRARPTVTHPTPPADAPTAAQEGESFDLDRACEPVARPSEPVRTFTARPTPPADAPEQQDDEREQGARWLKSWVIGPEDMVGWMTLSEKDRERFREAWDSRPSRRPAPQDDEGPRAHRDAAGVLWVPVEVEGGWTCRPAVAEPTAAEHLAHRFHEIYERPAPSFGYETRRASAVPWDQVPEQNRALMTAVCAELRLAVAEPTGDTETLVWVQLPADDVAFVRGFDPDRDRTASRADMVRVVEHLQAALDGEQR